MSTKNYVIAIDGYSSCGKSTLARAMAKKLGYRYVDTGAMYRAVTLFAVQNNYILGKLVNENALVKALDDIHVNFEVNAEGENITFLNGVDVETEIRSPKVSGLVSYVAQIRTIRKFLVNQQKRMGVEGAVVMDGRDIGTVVFPDADLKLFVTSDIEVRAKRRHLELQGKNINISLKEVEDNLVDRDNMDTSRSSDPLVQAADAIVLDNTHYTQKEQLKIALGYLDDVKNIV